MMFARCAQLSIAVALLFNMSVASAASPRVPNDLYGSAPLTFVVGTMGDDASDRIVNSQVSFIRSSLFPQSGVVADTAIARAGSIDWPEYAVV